MEDYELSGGLFVCSTSRDSLGAKPKLLEIAYFITNTRLSAYSNRQKSNKSLIFHLSHPVNFSAEASNKHSQIYFNKIRAIRMTRLAAWCKFYRPYSTHSMDHTTHMLHRLIYLSHIFKNLVVFNLYLFSLEIISGRK